MGAEESRFAGHAATYCAGSRALGFAASICIRLSRALLCPVPYLSTTSTLGPKLEQIHVHSASASVSPLTKRPSAPSLISAFPFVPSASAVSLVSDGFFHLLVSGQCLCKSASSYTSFKSPSPTHTPSHLRTCHRSPQSPCHRRLHWPPHSSCSSDHVQLSRACEAL